MLYNSRMKLTRGEIASFCIVALVFVLGWYFYPRLPELVASHWNMNGQVNGYTTRFWGAYGMPVILAVLSLIFTLVPRIDPKRANIEKFRGHYDNFLVVFFLFMLYIYSLTLARNLGSVFNLAQYITPAIGVLFFNIGVLLSHSSQNWFIGIRTPWTLSSVDVWNKTHALGGKLFKLSGLLAACGFIFPAYSIFFILVPVLFSSILVVYYSYSIS